MGMEFVNRICPNCKNPNYMVFIGDFSKEYKYKCANCHRFFNDIDFEKEPLQPNLSTREGAKECEEYANKVLMSILKAHPKYPEYGYVFENGKLIEKKLIL